MKKLTVGMLREQTALCDADTEVVLVIRNLNSILEPAVNSELIGFYPDTVDEKGDWKRTFKIVVAIKE